MPPRARRNTRRDTRRKNFRKTNRFKKRAYAPKKKKMFIAKSNPIAENKKIEGTEISQDVGRNAVNNPILNDFSQNPHYGGNEPNLDEDLPIAFLPTGARGYPLRDSVFNFNPDSCLYQTQGIDSNSMIGSSVYQRMCAAKILIRWPQPTMLLGKWNGEHTDYPEPADPTNPTPAESLLIAAWLAEPRNQWTGLMPETPQSYHMYWGFVKTPTGYSSFTDPKKDECSATDLERHINLRVEEWFNERTDRLNFIPKADNNLIIIGKKKLSPPWDSRNSRMPVSYTAEDTIGTSYEGVIPDTLVKIKWPINKKIHFTQTNNFSGDGVQADGTPVSGVPTFYGNHRFLPFMCIVNWNANSLPKNAARTAEQTSDGAAWTEAQVARDRRVPHVLINDITYYRDQ